MPESIVKIPPTIIVRDLAAKLSLPITTVTAELIKNGIMAALNEEIDFDTAVIIAEDLGKKVELQSAEEAAAPAQTVDQYLKEKAGTKLVARPPVVVVMGHVDHGKTSLLDAIRQTAVTAGEAGGITQRIGAYQITDRGRQVSFVDTPGHEAFAQMRARGAKIADVAILVVAADDGVKPQTLEALDIIHHAGIPYIVALTKTDKDEAQPERVKKELAEHKVLIEEFGGQTPVVLASAKTKAGLPELLESVLLLADVHPEAMMVNPNRPAVGTIIESHVDPQQGPLASVLIHAGTLHLGDDVLVGQVWGKVRSMKTDRGQPIAAATPSTPVQILGLKAAPQIGDILRVAPDEVRELKKKVRGHQIVHHLQTVVGRRPTVISKKGEKKETDKKPRVEKLHVILKTDTLGSAEAITESLKKFVHPEVGVEIVQRGLGIITETEVLRAEVAKAAIYGFNVPISPKADQLARSKGLTIRSFKVIYDLLDDVQAQLETMLQPVAEEKEIGRLKILAVFRHENTFQVVGGKVTTGHMRASAGVDVIRQGQTLTRSKITQLQQNKQNTETVTVGNEAGLKVEGDPIIQVGDELVAFVSEVRQRRLDERVAAV